ncbi:cysteine hydrolase family protein [Maridesulfovibrio frigidus]|uniref:cysteine hydrolase family protein n=1 Tax=Maridesulfovibrio frigidus TaxID=340956 RepID=UPI0004E16039|nr:cysteine hydrolase family protein [Maridesulfovibrio frigidus]
MRALLVIDMQRGLFEGAKKRFDAENVIKRINGLIDRARKKEITIIFIRHNGPPEQGLELNSEEWQILPELHKEPSDMTIDKTCCDSFCSTNLKEELDKLSVNKLIITGCCTDFCVDSTARQATSLGYEVMVASDAHTTADKPHLDAKIIIEHHNFVWSEIYSTKAIIVRPAKDIF